MTVRIKNDITIAATTLHHIHALQCVHNINFPWWDFEQRVHQEMDMQVKIVPHTILFKILLSGESPVAQILQMLLPLFQAFSLCVCACVYMCECVYRFSLNPKHDFHSRSDEPGCNVTLMGKGIVYDL